MDFSISALAAGFIYGVFGMYLIKVSRKQSHVPNLIIGIALVIYPYFIDNDYLLWGIGAALLFAAYRLKDY